MLSAFNYFRSLIIFFEIKSQMFKGICNYRLLTSFLTFLFFSKIRHQTNCSLQNTQKSSVCWSPSCSNLFFLLVTFLFYVFLH